MIFYLKVEDLKNVLIIGAPVFAKFIKEVLEEKGYNVYTCSILPTLKFKQALKAKILSMTNYVAGKFDVYHFLFSPTTKIFESIILLLLKIRRRKVIIHWIGGDDYLIKKSRLRRYLTRIFWRFADVNLAVAPWVASELRKFGVRTITLPAFSPIKIPQSIPKFPTRVTFLVYLPKHRWQLFNGDLIIEFAKRNPQYEFLIVGNDGSNMPQFKNIKYLGQVSHKEMEKVYSNVTALLRITKRDGFPLMIVESLIYARYVIFSRKMPYVYEAKTIQEMEDIARELEKKRKPNIEGRTWILHLMKQTKENLIGLYNYLTKGSS